jgi:hypothetical protein
MDKPHYEGWTWIVGALEWHYFASAHGLDSLCGRYTMIALPGDLTTDDGGRANNCPACAEALRRRQDAETGEIAAGMLRNLISTLKTGACYHCQSKNLKKIGRCVYCMDCNQRLYQGSLPKPQQEEGKDDA